MNKINISKNNRNSSFELFKVVAIICIIFCHSVPTERIEYHFATSDMWLFGVMLFRQLGSVGNAIFIVASTWFLVDSDKINLCKVRKIIADNQLISITSLLLMFGAGYFLSYEMIIKNCFPFLFQMLWFITCYVIYYCLHGFVNKALRDSELNFKYILIFIFIYDCIVCVYGGLYFNELIGFLIIHVFTFCLKKLLNNIEERKVYRIGIFWLVCGIVGWLVGALILNYVGVRISFIGENFSMWNKFYNPFILSIAYGAMLIASCKSFKFDVINMISSYSLYIYMITGNQLLRIYIDNWLYDVFCGVFETSSFGCFLFTAGYAVIKFVVGLALSILYKYTLGRLVSKMVTKEYNFVTEKLKL